MSCSQCRPYGEFPAEGVLHIRTDHPVLEIQLVQGYYFGEPIPSEKLVISAE
jgi:hypothetical protein